MRAGRRGGALLASGAACLVVLAGVVAAGPPPSVPMSARRIAPAPVSRVDSQRRAIERLLRRRAGALLHRDRRAFMATVARDDPAFVARQSALLENLEGVPLRSYGLSARWERAGDLATKQIRARYEGAQGVALPVTEERYRIAYDDGVAVEDLYYTFVKRRGRWLIGGDDDVEPMGLLSARHLWDFGPVTASRSAHFLLLEHPGSGLGAGFLELAERALTRVDAYWRERWSRRVVVLAPATEAELQRMLGVTYDVGDFVAFASSSADPVDGGRAPRIIASPAALAGRSPEDIEDVLAHELVHIATSGRSGPFVPAVVEEGLAEYVGRAGEGLPDLPAPAGGRLPTDSDFATGTRSEIFRRYQQARSAVAYFVRRFGFHDFVRFYVRLGSQRVTAGTAAYHVDETMRAVTGLGYRSFEAAWADSIER